jgi:hypothetical protein
VTGSYALLNVVIMSGNYLETIGTNFTQCSCVGAGMDPHGPLTITLKNNGKLFINNSKFTDYTTTKSDGSFV